MRLDLKSVLEKAISPGDKAGQFTFTNTEWLESTFQKRECIKIIPSLNDEKTCGCGQPISTHPTPNTITGLQPAAAAASSQPAAGARRFSAVASLAVSVASTPAQQPELGVVGGALVLGGTRAVPAGACLALSLGLPPPEGDDKWECGKHTAVSPTDAYGCIDFRGGTHTNKAQYIRLSHDTRPDLILSLLLREWGLERPKLLITVAGGKTNCHLTPGIKKGLSKGLLKAAKTAGAWIFTGGTNTGVSQHVGDALVTEKSPRIKGGRVVSIGFAPWGIVDKRDDLVGRKQVIPVHPPLHRRSHSVCLNKNHSYFFLSDNGTVGQHGAELSLRRRLERYISAQRVSDNFSTPLVCLVIEGGTNTIRGVLEYVTDNPPVPVVVCDGTGRAADLIAFAYRYGSDGDGPCPLEEMREELTVTIAKTFHVIPKEAKKLFQELLQCVKKKHLITVFRGFEDDLDQRIMRALFKANRLLPTEQLSLALMWNRCDLAEKEIFVEGQDWPLGALDEAMQVALESNRVDFVRLLLDQGVEMGKYLNIARLESLYNTTSGPPNTLGHLIQDIRSSSGSSPSADVGSRRYTLLDIGEIINQLMGSGFFCPYSRPNFKKRYEKHKGLEHILKTSSCALFPVRTLEEPFQRPFSDLIIWAVLTKRKEIAKLMWENGEQALSKALIASRLCHALAKEAAEDDLDVEVCQEFKTMEKEFEDLSLELLDSCYLSDDDLTMHLLTASMENWSRKTCLSLAVRAKNIRFLAHPVSQAILGDLWMGGLRMRKNPALKIILGLIFPPSISKLDFKSSEELKLMPKTEESTRYNVEDAYTPESPTSTPSGQHQSPDSTPRSSITGGNRDDGGDLESKIRTLELGLKHQDSKISLPEKREIRNLGPQEVPPEIIKPPKSLRFRNKLQLFYSAPITKYYCHFLFYSLFLGMYTYISLVRTPETPSFPEIYVLSCMITTACELFRTFHALEPVDCGLKLRVWVSKTKWNIFDCVAILTFLVAFGMRFVSHLIPYTHAIYATGVCYWYVRSLKLISVHKYFGPYVMMISRMIDTLVYFILLLLIVLMAFGVSRQGILYPNEDAHWRLIRHIFYQPYFMLYGEVFAPDIDPECNPECQEYGKCGTTISGELLVPCNTARWMTPIIMTIYLLVANILLINLLIAAFNTIYNEVSAISHQLCNFQRFSVVIEYEQRPKLPPPFIVFSHLISIGKYVYRCITRNPNPFESGLKLFLSDFDMERLYDFEEEAVESLQRSKKKREGENSEAKVDNILKLSKEFKVKLNVLEKWEAITERASRALESRLDRLEGLAEQATLDLAELKQMAEKPTIRVDFVKDPSAEKYEAESGECKEGIGETRDEDCAGQDPIGNFLSVPRKDLLTGQRNKQNAYRKTSMMERSTRFKPETGDCHCLKRRHSFTAAAAVHHHSISTREYYSTITETLERKISTVQAPIPKDPERTPTEGSQIMLLESLREAEKTVYDLMEGVIAERLGVTEKQDGTTSVQGNLENQGSG